MGIGDWGREGPSPPRNGLVTAGKLRSDRTRSEGPEGASKEAAISIRQSVWASVRPPIRGSCFPGVSEGACAPAPPSEGAAC